MKIKTFKTKKDEIIDVYLHSTFNESFTNILINKDNEYHGWYYNYNEFLEKNSLIECFDTRYLININGKSHLIILENDTIIPSELNNFSNYISTIGLGKLPNIKREFLDLEKSSNKNGYDKYLYDYLIDNKIKNVLIDSIFKNKIQFEHLAKKVFRFTNDINILINSHGVLLCLLNKYTEDREIILATQISNIYDLNFNDNLIYKIEFDNVKKMFVYKSKFWFYFKTNTGVGICH